MELLVAKVLGLKLSSRSLPNDNEIKFVFVAAGVVPTGVACVVVSSTSFAVVAMVRLCFVSLRGQETRRSKVSTKKKNELIFDGSLLTDFTFIFAMCEQANILRIMGLFLF